MKEQLRSLGYAVPNTNYAMQVSDESAMGKMPRRRSDDDVAVEDDGMDDANDASGKVSLGQHPAPVSYSTHVRTRGHLAQEQVEQPGRSHVEDGQMEQGSSGRKRKYVDLLDPLGNNGRSSDGVQIGRPIESRDMMPPPPLPLPKRPRLESQLSNIQNQPFSTPNPRADLREVHADDSSSTIRQGQKLTDAHREQSHMPFIQERQDFGENLPSGELSMHGYPPKGRNTPFGLPAKQSDRNYGVGPTYPDHSSMTSSRSTDKGRLLAPRTSNDSATLQDGELDRQFLYTQQQNPPARLTPSPSRNRLTLPPPPPTINRKNSPSRQGLFANIRSSASSESLPHRQPLAFSFGYGKQSTTPSWQQSYPHTPRRTLGSAQEAFVYPAQMSRNTNTATQQLSLVNDRRSSNSRLSLSQQSTSPFFMIDGSRSGNNFHDVETSTDSRTFLQGFRVDAHPQINTSTNHYPSTSSPFIADPRISSIADQHRFQPVVHEPASNDTSSGSMARFMPAYNPGLLHDPNRRGMAASRQTTSGLYTPAPTTTGSAFRPNGSSGPSMLKGQGIPGVARQAEDMHLGGFLRRDEYENGPRGLFSASGRRSVRR